MKKPTTTIGLYDEKNEFPLTVPVENKDRQQLAYNMLYYMAEKRPADCWSFLAPAEESEPSVASGTPHFSTPAKLCCVYLS